MILSDKYKNELDKIVVSEELKNKILMKTAQRQQENAEKSKASNVFKLRYAVGCAACFVALMATVSSIKEIDENDLKALLHAFDYHNLTLGKNTDDLFLKAFLTNNYNQDLKTIYANYGYGNVLDLKNLFGTEKKPIEPSIQDVCNYAYDVANNLYKISKRI